MFGPFVHDIDPILGSVGGVHLWWYGLGYTLGFLHMLVFLTRNRRELRLTPREVYSLLLTIIAGVLLGGRLIEVASPSSTRNPSSLLPMRS